MKMHYSLSLAILFTLSTSTAFAGSLQVEADDYTGTGIEGATVVVSCQRQAPNLPILRAGVTNAQGIFNAGEIPDGTQCTIMSVSVAKKVAKLDGSVTVSGDQIAYEPLVNPFN